MKNPDITLEMDENLSERVFICDRCGKEMDYNNLYLGDDKDFLCTTCYALQLEREEI
jgi:hypothetical protein